jgi:ribosomal-protein-serine acetyltransferase
MEDLYALWEAIDAERERLGVWMPWIDSTRTLADERDWLQQVTGEGSGLAGLAIWVEGELAGGIGLMTGPFSFTAEIGYWIRSEFEGRGLVTRACEALIDFAFDDLGMHRIVIRAGVENSRSRAIPERLGFALEGVLREDGHGSAGFHDLAVYGLLEREWGNR